MTHELLPLVDRFLKAYRTADRKMSDARFGFNACKNSRLVERLRAGKGRTVATDARVRSYIRKRSEELGIVHLVFPTLQPLETTVPPSKRHLRPLQEQKLCGKQEETKENKHD